MLTMLLLPIKFGVSSNLNPQSQSHGFPFNETWPKRPTKPHQRLRSDTLEMTKQFQ